LRTILFLFFTTLCYAAEPDWTANVPAGGRSNPYQFTDEDFLQAKQQGKIHAQHYPVSVTGMLPPYAPIKRALEDDENLFRVLLKNIFASVSGLRSLNEFLAWVGLHPYPKETDTGVYSVPYPDGKRPEYPPMGFGLI